MVQSSMRLLKERTGRSADEWAQITREEGPDSVAARREWLKATHGFTTNYAWWIAGLSAGEGLADMDPAAYLEAAEGYVAAMFAGKRAALRPLYDELLRIALALGDDVKACPGKTIVPLYRRHVFAELKPATNTRIDLGLALGDQKISGRLIDTGGLAKKDRITHRIPIATAADIDQEARRWLAKAYQRDT
jgi:hypothetical protein